MKAPSELSFPRAENVLKSCFKNNAKGNDIMEIDKKKITAAFENFNPTEEQKDHIYESILNTQNAEIADAKKISSGRFRGKRMGSVIAAAAAVLATGTLAVSALGLIDLQGAFGRIFDKDVDKLEAITTASEDYVTEGDGRLSLSLMAVGGTETEAIGAIKIVRNDGGTFPDELVLHRFDYSVENDRNSGMNYDLTVENETTAVLQFRIASDRTIKGSTATLTFNTICDGNAYQRAFQSIWRRNAETEDYEKAIEDYSAIILDGDWSITFPLDYNSECLNVDAQTPVTLRTFEVTNSGAYNFDDIGATVTKIGYSAISADVTFEGDYPILYLPALEVSFYLSDGSEMKARQMDLFADPYDYSGEYTLHCSFDYPVNVNDIERLTVNGTSIELK